MVGLGLLVTRVLARTWPFTVEDAVNRELAADRTGGWNDVSLVFSTLASTQMIVVVTVLVALVLRLGAAPLAGAAVPVRGGDRPGAGLPASPRWRSTGSGRRWSTWTSRRPPPASRPGTPRPPWRSTSASRVLLALRARQHPARRSPGGRCWCWCRSGVALTRMYRGMHHPSDVVASFLNGGTCVAIMARAVLDRRLPWGRAKLP